MKLQPLKNPPNPWASAEVSYLEPPLARPEFYEDHSREVIARNDSPDVPFSFSVNPYRGCMHACAYCYARPTHEYLGLGAGTDFDTRIAAKLSAPRLLRRAFERPSWKGELLAFSGVTDCYQPLEASLRLTRGCLEVCLEYRNPVGIVTKAPLVERDLDLLQALGREAGARVWISIPLGDQGYARALEPGVATPQRRLRTVAQLAQAGVRVGVMVAPFIPGLSERGLEDILRRAQEAGADRAAYVLLRLPGPVGQVFEERLRAALPLAADKVLGLVRQTRCGALSDASFQRRMVGQGAYAEAIAALFAVQTQRLGLSTAREDPPPSTFRRPRATCAQLQLL